MEIKMLKTYDKGLPKLKEGREYLVTNEFGEMLVKEGYAEFNKGMLIREAKLLSDHVKKTEPDIHIHFEGKQEEE